MRSAAVDDVGGAINPLILHGRTHGGIAQGVGQALLEHSYCEPQTGQLLAASFMDYAVPRADTLPFLATALSEMPAPTNRLGVRSGWEGGTTPALGVVINAVVNACRAGSAPYRDARDSREGMASQACGWRKRKVRAPSIPKLLPRIPSIPPPGALPHRIYLARAA